MVGQIEYAVSKFVNDSGGLLLKTEARPVHRGDGGAKPARRHFGAVHPARAGARDRDGDQDGPDSVGRRRPRRGHPGGERTVRAPGARYGARARRRPGRRCGARRATNSFGGVSSGMEKRTKVKTRIVATALAELISGSDNVLVMGHRAADLDCFGASVGIMKAARLMGKEAYVVIRRNTNLVTLEYERLLQNGFEGMFLEPEDALPRITRKTLLVICDTHVKHILESEAVFDACKNVVVVDHHRKMVGHIDKAVIFYHEPYASSASEMVTELVQYFGDKLAVRPPRGRSAAGGPHARHQELHHQDGGAHLRGRGLPAQDRRGYGRGAADVRPVDGELPAPRQAGRQRGGLPRLRDRRVADREAPTSR